MKCVTQIGTSPQANKPSHLSHITDIKKRHFRVRPFPGRPPFPTTLPRPFLGSSPDPGLHFRTESIVLLLSSLQMPALLLSLYFSPRPPSCFLWKQCLPTLSFQSRGQLAPEINRWPIRDHGELLSLPPWNLGKFPGGPLAQTCHESALTHRILPFPEVSRSLVRGIISSAIKSLL